MKKPNHTRKKCAVCEPKIYTQAEWDARNAAEDNRIRIYQEKLFIYREHLTRLLNSPFLRSAFEARNEIESVESKYGGSWAKAGRPLPHQLDESGRVKGSEIPITYLK